MVKVILIDIICFLEVLNLKLFNKIVLEKSFEKKNNFEVNLKINSFEPLFAHSGDVRIETVTALRIMR